MRNVRSDRGTALIEAAITIPILLLVAVGIFEFGRAFQTWQVLTNATREGARLAVTPSGTTAAVQLRVQQYLQGGQLTGNATILVNRNMSITVSGVSEAASQVRVDYPFRFAVLAPIARLVNSGSNLPNGTVMLRAETLMRNETP